MDCSQPSALVHETPHLSHAAPPSLVVPEARGIAQQLVVSVVLLTLGWVHDSVILLCAAFILSPLGRIFGNLVRTVSLASPRHVVRAFFAAVTTIAVVVAVSALGAWTNDDGVVALGLMHDLAARPLYLGILGATTPWLGRPSDLWTGPRLALTGAAATFPFAIAGALAGSSGIHAALVYLESNVIIALAPIALSAILAQAWYVRASGSRARHQPSRLGAASQHPPTANDCS